MIIGLTGGIGSGKSAAANFFHSEGVTVLDADQLAREVIEQNTPGFQSIVDYFGSDIIGEDGSIDRAKLRQEIFDDKEKKKAIESITHPLVRDLMAERIAASTSPYSIIMVPLIFETNSMSAYNRILVIDCDTKLQLERATLRDNNSSEQIQKILDSQCSRTERLSIANDVIPNNDTLENLKTRSLAMHKFYLGLCKK
ncbi:dephospho-CoA kinase [Gammaproteobacteria bacterium]|jgi:dephospho-CoA kinase|nr:dephospho-CoA kinase [SAR86 cluster bacterium]MDA9140976.1 dephospho-CoA kinase [Gammaproteobacteria bacterium]MBL6702192.1 dephospho-CoA kinase [SAR86 cluster bacterium]MDA9799509.1 dephospho-CoA kinase [Gammaproteobacteria bacterium]MDB2410842.1 dephospho-CoA kinase [Gammaproteobacteria bacterium]|tara:strand:- start:457 stop:1050 length:594 start_codon:yes stop_codon:yes gene_type:complete